MKDKIISLAFHQELKWEEVIFIISFLQKKIDKGYLLNQHEGYTKQIARVLRNIFTLLFSCKMKTNSELHISMPYFTKDVSIMPDEVISIREVGLNWMDLIQTIGRYILILIIIPTLPIKNRSMILGSISMGMVYYTCIKRRKPKSVHFHGYSYVLDVPALVYLLKLDDKIEAHFHEYVSFVDDCNYIICDTLHNLNEISSSYAQINHELYSANSYRFDISYKDLLERAAERDKDKKTKIGVYSSAFYCRTKHGYINSKWLADGIKYEAGLFELVKDAAIKNPSLEFIIYIHTAREIESHDVALEHYYELLKLPNIYLMEMGANSSDEHLEINLGLTVISNVFWDRLLLGCKTVLVNPFACPDFIEQTGLKDVSILTNSDVCYENLLSFYEMSNQKFITTINSKLSASK